MLIPYTSCMQYHHYVKENPEAWVVFTGDHCKTCGPVKRLFEGDTDALVVDVERAHELTASLCIRSVPTVLYLKGGRVMDSYTGCSSDLIKRLKDE